MIRLTLLALLVVVPVAFSDDQAEPKDPKAPKTREIKVKLSAPLRGGAVGKPTKITTAEELGKEVTDADARKEVLKEVNFKKEYLLLFRWAGSGGDRLSFTSDEKTGEVSFALKRGLTRDLRSHVKLFALPKAAKYKMGM